MYTKEDREIIRSLAKQVRAIADLPEQEAKREMWRKHTSLQGERPPIFVSPEGSWAEILPESALQCQGAEARQVETELRRRLFRYASIRDDTPIEKVYDIPVAWFPLNSVWGVQPKIVPRTNQRGSWHYDPIIEEPSDWKRLCLPDLPVDREGAQRRAEALREAAGDDLDVRVTRIKVFDFHIAHLYCDFRGYDNLLYDLIDEPEMVEDAFSFFEEGIERMLRQAEEENLIDCNSDHTYHYTGGLGYTRDLPVEKPEGASYSDIWGAAEDQEYAVVSPEMFAETVFPHERRLLRHFGLTGYGCCDDLTEKLDSVLTIPRLRRVAACPWANLEKMADRLKKDYILTWKPNPAHIAAPTFDEAALENYMIESLRQARSGYPEIILRDTHSCRGDASRFGRFVEITRRAIDAVYGAEPMGQEG